MFYSSIFDTFVALIQYLYLKVQDLGLGLLAGVQEKYAEAKANFQKALEIYVEYKDDDWAVIAGEALERLPE